MTNQQQSCLTYMLISSRQNTVTCSTSGTILVTLFQNSWLVTLPQHRFLQGYIFKLLPPGRHHRTVKTYKTRFGILFPPKTPKETNHFGLLLISSSMLYFLGHFVISFQAFQFLYTINRTCLENETTNI